jgi:hypothetical protein
MAVHVSGQDQGVLHRVARSWNKPTPASVGSSKQGFPFLHEEEAVIDPHRHTESRNAIESLLRRIPGFKGYLEKEYRRESDHLARTWIADQLQLCKTHLDRWQRSLVDEGQIDVMPAADRLRTRIDTLQSRVKGAMRGYSGFFDFVKVDETLLDQVYQLDLGLASDVSALELAFQKLAEPGGPPKEKLNSLDKQLEEINRIFQRRSEILEGVR